MSTSDLEPRTRVLRPDDVMRVRAILDARLARDASSVVFSVTADAGPGVESVQLCLVDMATRTTTELTDAGSIDMFPVWSEDCNSVVFVSTRAGASQLFRVDVRTGALDQLTWLAGGVGACYPAMSPDGRRLAFTGNDTPPDDPTLPHRVRSAFWRMDGVGRIEAALQHVHVLDLDSGDVRTVTDDRAVVVSVSWSPSGREVLHASFQEADEPVFSAHLTDLESGTTTVCWEEEFLGFPPRVTWLPDGRIVRTSPNTVVGKGEQIQLLVGDATPGAATTPCELGPGWLFGYVQHDFVSTSFMSSPIVVSPDGAECFVPVQTGGRIETHRVSIDGSAEQQLLIGGEQCSVPLDAAGSKVLVATSTLHEPPDLWLVDTGDHSQQRITAMNKDLFGPDRHFDVTPLGVEGADGVPVEGWFLRPSGSSGPVPTILMAHGGPHAAWGHAFSLDFCLLADAGYGVILANGRGSIGYTPEFASQLHGDYAHHDMSDLMNAVDAAVDAGLASGELGVWGSSGGGYLAAWLITHSARFSAAMIESPHIDWMTQFGADGGWLFPSYIQVLPGNGEASMERVAGWSPTWFAAQCKTPTLIVQHEADLRTPASNSDIFYALLKMHGCETEMLRMPRTSHNGSSQLGDPRARVAQNEALLEWFDRFLGSSPRTP